MNGFIHYYPPSSDESNILEMFDSLSDEDKLQFLLTGKADCFGLDMHSAIDPIMSQELVIQN